jgi:hypothetical protein
LLSSSHRQDDLTPHANEEWETRASLGEQKVFKPFVDAALRFESHSAETLAKTSQVSWLCCMIAESRIKEVEVTSISIHSASSEGANIEAMQF